MSRQPEVTIAVPSYNQGQYLDRALTSIFEQDVAVEVFITDGGSTDDSLDVIRKWESRVLGWRSHQDNGQASAINEGIAQGVAPFVCWLNSDDWFLPRGLSSLMQAMKRYPLAPMAYGNAWHFIEKKQSFRPVWVEPFHTHRLALRSIISQPATLIRRFAWEKIGGLDATLHMAMDYDLWWRLFKECGLPIFVNETIAVNRNHANTKTRNRRRLHYQEARRTVRKHYGRIPIKWWLAHPYKVWFKTLANKIR